MKLKDLMTTDVITVGAESSLKDAARRMIEAGISGLVVTDGEGTIRGVITEADFVKAESDRRAPKRAQLLRWLRPDYELPDTERLVGDVMTLQVITLDPDSDHAEASRVMRKEGIKRIPVVDDGRLVGIVSRSDILKAFARPDSQIIGEVEERVMRKVLWIDPNRITVTSVDGNVHLKGQLETRSDATLLEDLVKGLDGVVSVSSDLTWEVDNTQMEMTTPPPIARRRNW
jgi:CBS domain-containing protein